MIKDVKIKVVGTQVLPDGDREPEIIEMNTMAVYYEKDGHSYVKYDEYTDGIEKPVKNLIKFNEESLQITKKGSVSSIMSFADGKDYTAHYMTEAGPIFLGIATDKYHVKRDENEIHINLEYDIDFNYDYITHNSLNLIVDMR
jgi:uncharacterized beta-barrel protein YwiB (DUF1934 family)